MTPQESPVIEETCALLDLLESITVHRTLQDLLDDLAPRAREAVGAESLVLVMHEPGREDALRLKLLAGEAKECAVRVDTPCCAVDSPGAEVLRTQAPVLVSSVAAEARFPRIMELLREHGVGACWYFPLTTPRQRLGALGFCRSREGLPSDDELEMLTRVANHVALAVENATNREESERLQAQLTSERDRLRLLLEVNAAIVSHLDLRRLIQAVGESVRRVLGHDYTSLALHEPEGNLLRIHGVDFASGGEGHLREGAVAEDRDERPRPTADELSTGGGLRAAARSDRRHTWLESTVKVTDPSTGGRAFATRRPVVARTREEMEAFTAEVTRRLLADGMQAMCSVPLMAHGRALGTLNVASRREGTFAQPDVELIEQVAGLVAPAVVNALSYREIEALKDRLDREKQYLEAELTSGFDQVVGESGPLRTVLEAVRTVAPTDSTVLIVGETGTGKERIARAIHERSGRRDRTFVKVNCAAIPTGLLESELFGHEKGAFTGAIAQRIGRFELAHQGTLFLDEVGDIPPELQPKLLRVLQEREFERLGSTKTQKVDVRLIAATNRDLAQMVADREFRSDLYYRLNVFPISLPPLRERAGDVELLVRHFVERSARRMGRRIETIPDEALAALVAYPWPGNVRELENLVERSVILSPGPVLQVPLAELRAPSTPLPGGGAAAPRPAAAPAPTAHATNGNGAPMTLADAERAHIVQALDDTGWVVGGAKGAAARLGMSRTTLQSKMQKLGIVRPR